MLKDIGSTIRRHADGSIDTDYYLARGRVERSRQAHHLMAVVTRLARRLWPDPGRYSHVAGPSSGLRHGTRPGLV